MTVHVCRVSIMRTSSDAWLKAGFSLTQDKISEAKESDAARSHYHSRMRVGQLQGLRTRKARSIRQRCNLFAPDLQRGPGLIGLRSALCKRAAWHVMLRLGTSLRAAFAAFRRRANAVTGLSLSAGATRREATPVRGR